MKLFQRVTVIVLVITVVLTATAAVSGTVTAQASTPGGLGDDVTDSQYSAVAGDDGIVSAVDMASAINEWANSGSVDGVDISAAELSAIGSYWVGENQDSARVEVSQSDVSLSGSTISVETGGKSFISVSELPSDVRVSNISDGGIYNSEEGSILWGDLGGELSETVTFTLAPNNSYAAGDTISFSAGSNTVTVDVTVESPEDETSVPSELADIITEAQFSAIDTDSNGEISKSELTEAKAQVEQTGQVNGVDFSIFTIADIANYYGYDIDDDENSNETDDGDNEDSSGSSNGPVAQEEVSLSGSTITVSTGGANSISVSELPSDVSVSSESGTYNAEEGSILWTDFGGGLPETVSFTLTPDESYTDGDTLSFTAAGTSVTLDVVEIKVSSPVEEVGNAQYAAVAGDDGEMDAPDLSDSINQWSETGSVNGVDVGAPELSRLINYWANN